MTSLIPIRFHKLFSLQKAGINQDNISIAKVTMESDKFIVVREKVGDSAQQVVILDVASPNNVIRMPMSVDSALMNPNTKILALKSKAKNRGIALEYAVDF